MESLKELNSICQKPRYKEVGNWMVRHILRDAALPITWLLLHTPITANQVTTLSLVIGLLGMVCVSAPATSSFLLGVVLIQVWYLLDHVDGQIARYRKTASLTGRFFDFMTHHVIHGVIYFSLGFYVYLLGGSVWFIIWGFFASICMMAFNLVHDTKYKTFFEELAKLQSIEIASGDGEEDDSSYRVLSKVGLSKGLGVRRLFSWLSRFMVVCRFGSSDFLVVYCLTIMVILDTNMSKDNVTQV